MEAFIKELQDFDAWNIIFNVRYLNHFRDNNMFKEDVVHHKINKIKMFCNDLLIDENGHVNYDNIEILESHGYYVTPGERDRFGWLTGILRTTKGCIIFG